ncbi:MAG: hypothetical protein LZ158_04045, partial [Thaumarchaeota archaeon]|nr:hypothetical protein [Candidatus Terraquivivens yellowstonensis]
MSKSRGSGRSQWIALTALLAIALLLSSLVPLAHAQFRKATQLTLSPETFTINIAIATPETPIRLNITNSHITNISIAL